MPRYDRSRQNLSAESARTGRAPTTWEKGGESVVDRDSSGVRVCRARLARPRPASGNNESGGPVARPDDRREGNQAV
ncbi:MAG: hypothetical protein GY809_03405 [Planctomycetes bacterium]|nr:hypothetical protein [Planctomycetota bacterium]